jgi:di/tricarboxylate transporter
MANIMTVIVGQVTPDMIKHIRYGTFILFGLLITLGAAFIQFYVPEVRSFRDFGMAG